MVKTIFFLLFGSIALAITLSVRACHLSESRALQAETARVRVDGVVSLRHGGTMVAPEGTVGRDIVDWLQSDAAGERYFELGGEQFIGNSAELAADAWPRVDRFVAMFKANPDVRARLVGYSDASGNAPADLNASAARARRVMTEIADGGIARSRLSFEGRGSANAIADNGTPAGRARNRRVAIILSRQR
jgi:outer membrane protein OmpA-like peptidoglycan-associated protein